MSKPNWKQQGYTSSEQMKREKRDVRNARIFQHKISKLPWELR